MVFKNFRINIIARLLVILAGITLLAFWLVHRHYLRTGYLSIAIIILVTELIYYTDRHNRDMSYFFSALLSDDYMVSIKDYKKGRSFTGLYKTMNEVRNRFTALTRERETRILYLGSLIEQSRVGILALDSGNRIQLVNRAFPEITGISSATAGNSLSEISPEFMEVISQVQPGRHLLKNWKAGETVRPLSLQVSGFRLEDRYFRLITVQNIKAELDEKELESWQKLIRVLTHEIMNTITPVVSLSSSLNDLLTENDGDIHNPALSEKLKNGLNAIVDRSSGLMKFTEAYQHLARLPAPEVRQVFSSDLLKRMDTLFRPYMQQEKIDFNLVFDGKPEAFNCDPDQIEQVLINLLKNAVDAVTGSVNPSVVLGIFEHPVYQVKITLKDNGEGIPPENIEKIFIPFFSTRKKGSGIGLSISRQIVLMHRGMLEVRSQPGKGAEFEILL
jgi:nitrogen fixation/metabolism regulation signal transduction histidine kinase